jgi:hypothetical protein
MESIFTINVSEKLGPEYLFMVNDIARFVTIQIVIQLLLCTMNGQMFPFFSTDFLLLLLFIILGVLFYWLVVQKVIKFE